jgi:hypothetical protein
VQDAVLKFAISTTRTSSEASRFLGLDQKHLYPLVKKFGIFEYFGKKYKDRLSKEKKTPT